MAIDLGGPFTLKWAKVQLIQSWERQRPSLFDDCFREVISSGHLVDWQKYHDSSLAVESAQKGFGFDGLQARNEALC